MSSLSGLYPSASGGTGITSSPLSSPAPPAAVATSAAAPAEPVAPVESASFATQAEATASFTRLLEADPEKSSAAEPESVAVEPRIDDRPKIVAALADARMNEPAASSVTDYAAFARTPDGVVPDLGEQKQALEAMLKTGMGVTQGAAIWNVAMQAIRSPVTTNEAGAMQALRDTHGDNAEARLELAKGYISEVAKTYPGVRDFLNRTGLGNDPAMLKFAIEAAQRRQPGAK